MSLACADLTSMPLPRAHFHVIVVTRYLDRAAVSGALATPWCQAECSSTKRSPNTSCGTTAVHARGTICSRQGSCGCSARDGRAVRRRSDRARRGGSHRGATQASSVQWIRNHPELLEVLARERDAAGAAAPVLRIGVKVRSARDAQAEVARDGEISCRVGRVVVSMKCLERVEPRRGKARNPFVVLDEHGMSEGGDPASVVNPVEHLFGAGANARNKARAAAHEPPCRTLPRRSRHVPLRPAPARSRGVRQHDWHRPGRAQEWPRYPGECPVRRGERASP